MMARKMNSTRKSEAELLAAFAFFAAQTAKVTTAASSESGVDGAGSAGETAVVAVPPASDAEDTSLGSVNARTVIPNEELRHVLQNTGERMTPEHVDLVLSGSIASAGNGEVDYALLSRMLLA